MVPLALLAALLLAADVPRVTRLLPPDPRAAKIAPGVTVPVLPDLSPTTDPPKQVADKPKAEKLSPESRLAIVRYVAGEFARAVKTLPSGKDGVRIVPGRGGQPNAPQQASTTPGTFVVSGPKAANPGDTVQVTQVEFRAQEILLHINGGGKKKTRWRDRIQVSMGGVGMGNTTPQNTEQGLQQAGATLVIDFGKPIPDLTPDELKELVAEYLDFSKQRSASVQWIETLPPEFQEAIKEKRAVVGMDREMVAAAIGRPDKKIREKDADGIETEDWIYGRPPSQTIFVKFAGEKVISVVEYPK